MKKVVNKVTGQVGVLGIHNEDFWVDVSGTSTNSYSLPDPGAIIRYSSLPELAAEWEDYKEPKKYYYITSCGEITHRGYRLWENESVYDKKRKEIGNHFETEEEAEKAVKKLKAFERLKDKGFRFDGCDDACITYRLDPGQWNVELEKDFDLLFGGEE